MDALISLYPRKYAYVSSTFGKHSMGSQPLFIPVVK